MKERHYVLQEQTMV